MHSGVAISHGAIELRAKVLDGSPILTSGATVFGLTPDGITEQPIVLAEGSPIGAPVISNVYVYVVEDPNWSSPVFADARGPALCTLGEDVAFTSALTGLGWTQTCADRSTCATSRPPQRTSSAGARTCMRTFPPPTTCDSGSRMRRLAGGVGERASIVRLDDRAGAPWARAATLERPAELARRRSPISLSREAVARRVGDLLRPDQGSDRRPRCRPARAGAIRLSPQRLSRPMAPT